MALFVAFLFLLGYGVDRLCFEMQPRDRPGRVPVRQLLGGERELRGDRAVLASSAAVPLDEIDIDGASPEDRLRLKQLGNIADEISIASGLPRPRLYVIPDSDPNAFATGRDPGGRPSR